MYWLDIAAVSIVLVFGILGFSGWLNRLRGLLFGIILGVIIIGMTPFVLSRYDTGLRINPEESSIMRYLDRFVPDSLKEKYKKQIVSSGM